MASAGRGSRDKGARAEKELVELLVRAGVPSQRVIGSGAFYGAASDVKIGVTKGARDETKAVMRAEVKSRADNPEWLFESVDGVKRSRIRFVADVRLLSRQCPERLFEFLEQDVDSSIVVLRRNGAPRGALAAGDYDKTHMVCMGLSTFVDLYKRAYPKIRKSRLK